MAIEISRTGYSPLAKRHAVTYTIWRAASIFVAISANLWRITWKWPISLPNASRSLAYASVRSKQCCAPATLPAAPIMRSPWSSHMMW